MIRLALAAEDGAGEWVVRQVTDRHLLAVGWIDPEHLGHFRSWMMFEGQRVLPLKRVVAMARKRLGQHFRLSGHFDGRPGAADAHLLRHLFVLLADAEETPDIVVVARDVDGTDRRTGMAQAEAAGNWPFRIVGALAQPESEAWLVCMWDPEDAAETARHAGLRQQLGFDPVTRSHELTSTSDSKRDAKRVLEELTRTGRDGRERFAAASFETMRQRGAENGLAAFVDHLLVALAGKLGTRGPSS